MACILECNLATLHGFNTFLLKIFRAQMVFIGYRYHQARIQYTITGGADYK
jgi:hypothetical protein